MATNDVQDVLARFLAEHGFVQRYITVLRSELGVQEAQVSNLILAFQRAGLAIEEPLPQWRPRGGPIPHGEAAGYLARFRALRPQLAELAEEARGALASLPEPDGLEAVDLRSDVGEWIQYFIDALKGATVCDAVDSLREVIARQEEANRRELGGDHEPLSPEAIQYIIDAVFYIKAERKLYTIIRAGELLDAFELSVRMDAPESEISTFRQGFIILMTAFDAAVFDMVRIAFRDRFFALVGAFGRQEKISLESMGKLGSFEVLRDTVIEAQLKQRYLRDILLLLDDLEVPLTDASAGERFGELVELVLRRNVHVHNRGRVDERYLGRDQEGVPQYNIYNLAVGDLAAIDGAYWERAVQLTSSCIYRLASWVELLTKADA